VHVVFAAEPVFVARPGGTEEDDGVLLSLVTCADGSSVLVCLDGHSMKEMARAHLPCRVPYRFHGCWLE
jgi:carlactone synthase/all-trans-10'-apo-beta-carotenal 13,14-cleaving dioxygenase